MNHKTYAKTYPISPGQIKAIKMAQRYFDISDDIHRDILEDRFGVRSTRDLSFSQAGQLITENASKGFVLLASTKPSSSAPPKAKAPSTSLRERHPRPTRGLSGAEARPPVPRDNTKIISMVRPEEIDKLNEVAALIPWRLANGLALFLAKRMGIKDGRVRTSAEAYLAIEGLKKMFENGMKKAHGADWWRFDFAQRPEIPERSRRAIIKYIAIHKPAEWR